MIEMSSSGAQAAQASQSLGLYFTSRDNDDPFASNFTVDITDPNGVAFLRRLLTIDVNSLFPGHDRGSLILNALGLVTDFAVVAHVREGHYRVIFQSLDTLAWMHQVAKAFDVDFTSPELASALAYGPGIDTLFALEPGRCAQQQLNGHDYFVVRREKSLLIEGSAEAIEALKAIDAVLLDPISAETLSILADEPQALDWANGDVNAEEIGAKAYVDFKDPARMFIGRALTEARMKAARPRHTVILKSHQDNGALWFEDPMQVTISTKEGIVLAKTLRVGLVNESLITRVAIDAAVKADDCVWINGSLQAGVAYSVEEITC